MRSLRPDRSLGLAPATAEDYRELARRRLPRALFDYIDGGAYDEATLRANRRDLQELQLRQRVLRDVGHRDLTTTVLGRHLAMPVILAPVGLGGMFARRAEVQAARAAEAAGLVFVESTVSICSVEEVAGATADPLWFQLYVMRDRGFAAHLIARATAAGCETLVLTVDLAVVGARYRDVRNGLEGRLGPLGQARRGFDLLTHPAWLRDVAIGGRPLTFGNLETAVPGGSSPDDFKGWVDSQFDPTVTWDDLAWVREHWGGRLVLKGILDAEDARTAASVGVDAIVVSNHGGRQLDAVPSTIKAIGPVADAVGDDMEILLDGGIRSGLDVVKAVSAGARAVMVGRPWAWAVAGAGQRGVERLLAGFAAEMQVAMALTGNTSIDQLGPAALVDPAVLDRAAPHGH